MMWGNYIVLQGYTSCQACSRCVFLSYRDSCTSVMENTGAHEKVLLVCSTSAGVKASLRRNLLSIFPLKTITVSLCINASLHLKSSPSVLLPIEWKERKCGACKSRERSCKEDTFLNIQTYLHLYICPELCRIGRPLGIRLNRSNNRDAA